MTAAHPRDIRTLSEQSDIFRSTAYNHCYTTRIVSRVYDAMLQRQSCGTLSHAALTAVNQHSLNQSGRRCSGETVFLISIRLPLRRCHPRRRVVLLVTSGYRWSEPCCVHLGFNRLRAVGLCTVIDCYRGKAIILMQLLLCVVAERSKQ